MRRGADTQCPRLFPQRMHKTASKYPHVVYPVAEREQRFEDTSFGVALNALHRQGVVEERAQRFACRRTIDPKGWRIPLRTLTPMLAPPHSESHIQLIEQSKTRAATKVKHAAPPGNSSPKVGIPAFLHLIIQSQAGCQAC